MFPIVAFCLSFAGLIAIIVLNRFPEPPLVDDRSLAADPWRSAVDDMPTTSKSRAPERRSSVGYIATASSAAARRARNEYLADLEDRVAQSTAACNALRMQIVASEQQRDALPESQRGFPLSLVGACILISIAVEYSPTLMSTQALMTVSERGRWYSVIVFIAIAIVLALCFGELLRRRREPRDEGTGTTLALILVSLLGVLVLFVGYTLRMAYAAFSPAYEPGSATLEDLSLTVVAAVGMAVVSASSYYREGFEAFRLRNSVARMRRDFARSEAHFKTAQRDLARASEIIANADATETVRDPMQRRDDAGLVEDDRRL